MVVVHFLVRVNDCKVPELCREKVKPVSCAALLSFLLLCVPLFRFLLFRDRHGVVLLRLITANAFNRRKFPVPPFFVVPPPPNRLFSFSSLSRQFCLVPSDPCCGFKTGPCRSRLLRLRLGVWFCAEPRSLSPGDFFPCLFLPSCPFFFPFFFLLAPRHVCAPVLALFGV